MLRGLPPLTTALIAISVLIAWLSSFGTNWRVLAPLFISYYLDSGLVEIRSGQLWRLLSPIFIHFGFMHLAFNMLWLWELGRVIETRRSALLLGVFVVVSGILSNVAEYLYSGPAFGGMSGVVYGLLGYLWMQGRFNRRFGVVLHKPVVVMMLAWFVICWSGILELLGNVRVANVAHSTGLGIGVIWGFLAAHSGSRRV
jgi:membrane associated rhomboid family serine protease